MGWILLRRDTRDLLTIALFDLDVFHFYSRCALLWSPFGFEVWSWKCSRTDRFETLNFGWFMLFSFSAIFSQTFLSQLFEVCSWTARSTRSPSIKLHCVSRTTPWYQLWCLTRMTATFYHSERPNVLKKLQLSSTKSLYFIHIRFRFVLKVR